MQFGVVSLSLMVSTCYGASWYVSNDGNDSNNGTSAEQPFQTLQAIQRVLHDGRFKPSDSVMFRCNDTFVGAIAVGGGVPSGQASSPTSFSSYGCDAFSSAPVLAGSIDMATNVSWRTGTLPSVFTATVPSSWWTNNGAWPVLDIFLDGQRLNPAQWPEPGQFGISAAGSTSSMVCDPALAKAFPGTGSLVGSTLHVRSNNYVYDWAPVTSYAGGNASVASKFSAGFGPNQGYFLSGLTSFLSLDGEWQFNATSQQLSVYWSNGTFPPPGSTLRAAVAPYALDHEYDMVGNISVSGIVFQHYTHAAVRAFKPTGYVISNCTFHDMTQAAVQMPGTASGISITGNSISRVGTGLQLFLDDSAAPTVLPSLISNNTFNDVGIVPGWGDNGINAAVAIALWHGHGAEISYNNIENTGWSGIRFDCTGHLVHHNIVRNALVTMNDGGSLYTEGKGCGGHIIHDNVLIGLHGTGVLANSGDNMGAGLYLDNYSSNNTVFNNSVLDASGGAIVNAGSFNVLLDNVYLVRGGSCLYLNQFGQDSAGLNTTWSRQTCYRGLSLVQPMPSDANSLDQPLMLETARCAWDPWFAGSLFTAMVDNVYINPFSPMSVRADYPCGGTLTTLWTLAQWQRLSNGTLEAGSAVATGCGSSVGYTDFELGPESVLNPSFLSSNPDASPVNLSSWSVWTPSGPGAAGLQGVTEQQHAGCGTPDLPDGLSSGCAHFSNVAPYGLMVNADNFTIGPGSSWLLNLTLVGPSAKETFVELEVSNMGAGGSYPDWSVFFPAGLDSGPSTYLHLLNFSAWKGGAGLGSVRIDIRLTQPKQDVYVRSLSVRQVVAAVPQPEGAVACPNPSDTPTTCTVPGADGYRYYLPRDSPGTPCLAPGQQIQVAAWRTALLVRDLSGHFN